MLRRVFCKFLLVVVVIFSLLALSGAVMAQGRSEDAFKRAIAAQEKHTGVLIVKDGVEGTAVGLNENDQFVVKVYTARQGVGGIPQNLDGVPVQKVVTGKIHALVDPTGKFTRPVPTGVSTGHPDITAGTIACRVKDLAGNVYALSNNHVYANENRASIGDNVLQPGTYDGGTDPTDAIGTLYDYEPIVFGMWGVNTIDAAIAGTTIGLVGNSTPLPPDGYGRPNSTTVAATLGMPVQKYGRTTRLTTGTVTGVNGAFLVWYSRSYAVFYDQISIEVTGFSGGGDSGSLIVTNDSNRNPVGLLFAGSDTFTIANPIDAVLNEFGVTVDGGGQQEPTNNPPVANFSGSPTSGDVPLTVYFTDLSTENPTGWSWNFGDGGTSTAQNPSYTYNTAGTYSVTLTATNEYGSDEETKAAYINLTAAEPVAADFEASPTIGDAPLTVNFTDLSTGDLIIWEWYFGDGNFSLDRNPTYTYNNPGVYNVTLIVSDGVDVDMVTKVSYITVSKPGEEIILTAVGFKVKGRKTTDLTWSGATGTDVDIYRDGEFIITTANDGSYTDMTGSRGGGSFTYQVCEAGTSTCSNEVTVYY